MPGTKVRSKASRPSKKPAAPKARPGAARSKALPTFGRSGTAGKAEGPQAVRAWIQGVKPEHRPIVKRLDELITKEVPHVKKAVKWSMPMYGIEGQGWFSHIGSFKGYVALGFFAGTSLVPPPPEGEGHGMRRVKIPSLSDLDERQVRAWIRQASTIPGWGKA